MKSLADAETLAYPRLPAIAEIGWSAPATHDWKQFSQRLAKQGPLWDRLGIKYYKSPEVPWGLEGRVLLKAKGSTLSAGCRARTCAVSLVVMIWKVAVRIARRETLRHKGRSALVAAMLALPVAGASAADTLYHTTKLTTLEQLQRDIGQSDALSLVRGAGADRAAAGRARPVFPAGAGMLAGALQGTQVASPVDAGVCRRGRGSCRCRRSRSCESASPHGCLFGRRVPSATWAIRC